MRYGLTTEDIVMAFTGAITADFEAAGLGGVEVIEAEMDFQSAKLDSVIPAFVKSSLKHIDNEILDVEDLGLTDPTIGLVSPTLPAISGSEDFSYYMRGECPDMEDCYSESISADNNFDGTYNLYDFNQDKVLMDYDVDELLLVDDGLKGLLRDMVCCALGRKIYPSADKEWNVVSYHCEEAQAALQMIRDNPKWLPNSMIGMKFYRNIFASLNMLRS